MFPGVINYVSLTNCINVHINALEHSIEKVCIGNCPNSNVSCMKNGIKRLLTSFQRCYEINYPVEHCDSLQELKLSVYETLLNQAYVRSLHYGPHEIPLALFINLRKLELNIQDILYPCHFIIPTCAASSCLKELCIIGQVEVTISEKVLCSLSELTLSRVTPVKISERTKDCVFLENLQTVKIEDVDEKTFVQLFDNHHPINATDISICIEIKTSQFELNLKGFFPAAKTVRIGLISDHLSSSAIIHGTEKVQLLEVRVKFSTSNLITLYNFPQLRSFLMGDMNKRFEDNIELERNFSQWCLFEAKEIRVRMISKNDMSDSYGEINLETMGKRTTVVLHLRSSCYGILKNIQQGLENRKKYTLIEMENAKRMIQNDIKTFRQALRKHWEYFLSLFLNMIW